MVPYAEDDQEVFDVYGQPPGQQGQPPYGQPPQGPPPPVPPPMGAPVPPQPRKTPKVVLAVIGLAAVVFMGVVGVAIFQTVNGRVSGPLEADHCVDKSFGMDSGSRIPASERVDCDDPKAKAKVLKVTAKRTTAAFGMRSEPDCPEGTDGVTNVTITEGSTVHYEACVRNLEGPHPGDPGAGGALLSVGDCVSDGSFGFGKEKPCTGDDWYGKVIARVESEAACPAQTLETMKLRSFGGNVARPVLCLGPGGGVLANGDCITDPSFAVGGPKKAECDRPTAVAQVVGRVKSTAECPSEATHTMTAEGAFRPVMCLKKLRPTLSEKLRSLGG